MMTTRIGIDFMTFYPTDQVLKKIHSPTAIGSAGAGIAMSTYEKLSAFDSVVTRVLRRILDKPVRERTLLPLLVGSRA